MESRDGRRRSGSRGALASLASIAVVATLGAAGVSAAEARGQSEHAARLVLKPRQGEIVRSNHVTIRVRSRDLSGVLRARLNGVDVGGEFGRTRKGVRRLQASVSHGLHHGRNVLKVRVRRRGKPPRREKIRFAVGRHRPLVGAGRDRSVVIDSRSQLRGKVKRAPNGRPLERVRWRLIDGPRGARGVATRAKGVRAKLSSPRGLGTGFRPSVPGTYRVQLKRGSGPTAVWDRVTVQALPPSPLVPIETLVGGTPPQHHVGIRVGGKLYGNDGHTGLQVLVLERKTLGFVSNRVFGTGDDDDLMKTIDALDDTKLVIMAATGKSTEVYQQLAIDKPLARIGVPGLCGSHPCNEVPYPGRLSAIGVPGMAKGEADWNFVDMVPQSGPRPMNGYLTRDQNYNYGFVPSEREPFSYGAKQVSPCSPGDPPDRCSDVHVGYRVGIRDARTLAPRPGNGQMFDTNGRGLTSEQQTAEANRMAATLNAAAAPPPGYDCSTEPCVAARGHVVTIQAVSNRRTGESSYPAPIGAVSAPAMAQLAQAVAKVGGTRNAFNRSASVAGSPASGGAVYTLVGWVGAPEGGGAEVASGVDGAGDAPVLSGVLQPDRSSQFRPVQVTNSANDTDLLSSLMLEPPTSGWPLDDDSGAKRAIAYLGKQDSRLGGDPRAAYWIQTWTEATTDSIVNKLGSVPYPSDANFTEDAFKAARNQLIEELGWVGRVRTHLSNLSYPFVDTCKDKCWAAAHDIADQVYEAARKPDDEVAFRWIEFTESILHLLGPVTDDVSSEIGTALELGVWAFGATERGSPTDSEVRIKADKLGTELLDQANNVNDAFRRMGDVIVGDYAKLSVLGPQAGCISSEPDCEFPFSEADRVDATALVYRSIERVAYEKLLPLGFHMLTLTRHTFDGNTTRPAAPDYHDYGCASDNPRTAFYPWINYPPLASTSLLQELDPAGAASGWDTFVFAAPRGLFDQHGTPPSDQILTRMFDPVSKSGDRTVGGLGMSAARLALESEPHWWYGDAEQERLECHWAK